MDWLFHIFVWLSRISHCRGFGVQSPTDYHFVRYVVNEHWPYYAYEWLGKEDTWKRRKIGRLCFRLTNWLQPHHVLDDCKMSDYIRAASQRTMIYRSGECQANMADIELAIEPVTSDAQRLFEGCNDRSVIMFVDINLHKADWQRIHQDPRVSISYDLYYCGIVMFDSKRVKQHYIVNF